MRHLNDMCVACIAIGICIVTACILFRASFIWTPIAGGARPLESCFADCLGCGSLWYRPR